jgi:threonine/homoserine/homoserine lactone efflux protein
MLDFTTLIVFVGASLALLLVPGPSVLYIVARSISQGRGAGIVSTLGVGMGNVAHVLAAALGLSAILMSSAVAFTVVKYAGAAYLIYLGIRTLMDSNHAEVEDSPQPEGLWRIFSQGFVVNLLNPKTALFFLAFLPQFVTVSSGNITLQIVILGVTFTTLAIITDTVYALLSGTVGGWMRGNARLMRSQKTFAGGTYITLGVATALSGGNRS